MFVHSVSAFVEMS